MHFMLCSVSVLFMLTTLVQSAPTASLDAATLLQNAQEAQKLNAQFQSGNGAASGSCNNGDTTCVKNAIATCVNGQFDTSNGRCSASQQCFALPSVRSNGTIIACTSEKNARSLINASGATGDVTGSGGSGASTASISSGSASSTANGAIPSATTSSIDPDCMTTIASQPTAAPEAVVTVTITVIPSVPTILPSVTQTLSPDQASSALASLLAQGGPTATATSNIPDCSDEPVPVVSASNADTQPTATSDCSDEPSGASTHAAPTSITDIQIPPATIIQPTATPSTSSGTVPPSATSATAAAIANNSNSSASSGSNSEAGGYNGY